MERSGHIGLALLFITPVAIIAGLLFSVGWAIFSAIIAIAIADTPDLDQKIPAMSHRGFTHTLWAAIAVSTISGVLAWILSTRLLTNPPAFLTDTLRVAVISPYLATLLAVGTVFIAYLSHIVGDILTTGSAYYGMDIAPLSPVIEFSPQLRIFDSNSLSWNLGFFILGVGIHSLSLSILVL